MQARGLKQKNEKNFFKEKESRLMQARGLKPRLLESGYITTGRASCRRGD